MKMPQLDARLLAVANYVRPGSVIADVGCDHAYVTAYLLAHQICTKAYASDLNAKPLQRAKETLMRFGLGKNAVLLLSDGLNQIPREVDTVIIAGMGGELITEMIRRAPWLQAQTPDRRLILQPMSFAPVLRSYLAQAGFCILEETPVLDRHHTYCILHVQYSGIKEKITPLESVVGKMVELQRSEVKEYMNRQYQHYAFLAKRNGSKTDAALAGELAALLAMNEESNT